jgi:hypothetical protein
MISRDERCAINLLQENVQLMEEIGFWMWTRKMESYGCLFLLNSSNQHQSWDRCVVGLTNGMMTRVNKTDEGNRASIRIVKLVSAFHSG